MDYRRLWHPGGTYFFTINLQQRKNNDLLIRHIDLLRNSVANLIRDQQDFNAHMDYIHINPFKHGLVERVIDWPYSTFHKYVAQGIYPANWAGGIQDSLKYDD